MATEVTLRMYFNEGYVPSLIEVEEAFDCTVIEYEAEEV